MRICMCINRYVHIYIYFLHICIYINSDWVDQLDNASEEGSLNNIKMESSEANNKTTLYNQLLFEMLTNTVN